MSKSAAIRSRSIPRIAAFAFAIASSLALAAPLAYAQQGPGGGPGQGGDAPPRPAGYVTLSMESVPVRSVLTGRAVAPNATQLRPRVGGVITEILYSPGAQVAVGDPLFTIDPLTYLTALASAEATLARAEASLTSAQSAYDRALRLRQSSTASQAAFETAETALLTAQASRKEAEAALTLARAQADWTTIRSPIAGIIGTAQVAIGDLVTANQANALAEIVQINPILIDLTEPYPTRLRIEGRAARGEIVMGEPDLTLILDDGQRIEGAAKLLSSGATVSTTTGTRLLRFEVPNPNGRISPGMFLRAELTLGSQQALLVPQRATTRERDGSLTAWVAEDNIARKRTLIDEGTWGNAWVVRGGLKPDEMLLVDGTTNLRDGAKLAPVLAEIDPQGVVRDANASPAPQNAPGN